MSRISEGWVAWRPAYRNYLLVLLLLILASNYVDRWALGLVLQDIKSELRLSDTQLGVLSGIAFALFYSVMGIPIARWADRGDRILVVSLTTAIWSIAVALCGMATSFVQLLLIRVGVGIGEAGCIPPAHSLIADYFTREERPRAVGIYMLGGSVSVVIGYFVAGWLNEIYGWRAMFAILGLPGLALAVLAWFTLEEPRRARVRADATPEYASNMREVWKTLWASRTFRHLLWGFAVLTFFANGIGQWLPAFFIRSYGLGTGELGTWLAIIYGLCGIVGTYVGGEGASRYAAGAEGLQLRIIALAIVGFGCVSFFTYLAPNKYVAFGLLSVATVGVATISGPLFATLQTLVPERMRATSIALIYLFANLIGMGLGPLAAGVVSDTLRPWVGEESLRYALLALCPGFFWGAWHLWGASQSVSRDLAAIQTTNAAP